MLDIYLGAVLTLIKKIYKMYTSGYKPHKRENKLTVVHCF